MEEQIIKVIDMINMLNHPKCNNLYEFILNHSRIKMNRSDITEDEIRNLSTIQLKELMIEIIEKSKKIQKINNKSKELKLIEQISYLGINIFSTDETRKLYEKLEQSRTVLSADSITSLKENSIEKYQRYIDDSKEEQYEKAKVATREDLIKFLKEAKQDYTDEELRFITDKLNEEKHL